MTIKQLDEWFGNQGFRGLEILTRMKCYWFKENDGYQEFVDVCDNWWFALNKLEKQSYYDEVCGRLYY